MFEYILKKIESESFKKGPYKHLVINDFLSDDHLKEIIEHPQLTLTPKETTSDLIVELMSQGWEVIGNAGCRLNFNYYLKCLETNDWPKDSTGLLERFGLTFSLKRCESRTLSALSSFMNSDAFKECLNRKFNIETETNFETGVRKYLTGYEIPPHPDVRKKCLTYMLNINTHPEAEFQDIHTHVLKFKDEFEYIYKRWTDGLKTERCWVPWDWTITTNTMSINNQIIIFQPSHDTLHGVKLDYDHLKFQRTQLYGNFWYKDNIRYNPSNWINLS